MRRTSLTRLLSAILALWFALGLVEPAALHACPMHDGGAARDASATVAEHGSAHRGGHGGTAHAQDAEHSGAPAPNDAHACTCMGECGVAVAVAAPVVRVSEVPAIVAEGRPLALRSRVAARSASSYLFPPATAPPSARVG